MRQAMEHPTEHTLRNDKERTAMDDEEKEEHAAVASIITDKRQEFIDKILTANRIFNNDNIKDVERRVKKASLTALRKEYKTIEPFIAGVAKKVEKPESPPVIPFYANMTPPEEIDANQLNASSPDSAFAQLSTKELLEMTK